MTLWGCTEGCTVVVECHHGGPGSSVGAGKGLWEVRGSTGD